MFTQKQLHNIDRRYFYVYEVSPLAIKVRSKNTLHFWWIHSDPKGCKVLHSHYGDGNYHYHARHRSIEECFNAIKKHDNYQLKYRKPEVNDFDYYPFLPDSEYFVF